MRKVNIAMKKAISIVGSQKALANSIGVSQAAISKLLNGISKPKITTVISVKEVVGDAVSTDDFVSYEYVPAQEICKNKKTDKPD